MLSLSWLALIFMLTMTTEWHITSKLQTKVCVLPCYKQQMLIKAIKIYLPPPNVHLDGEEVLLANFVISDFHFAKLLQQLPCSYFDLIIPLVAL